MYKWRIRCYKMVNQYIFSCLLLILTISTQAQTNISYYEANSKLLDSLKISKLTNKESIISVKCVSTYKKDKNFKGNTFAEKLKNIASFNKISNSFYQLKNIEYMNASSYRLVKTDFRFDNFKKLKYLILETDSLKILPKSLKESASLIYLSLDYNRINKLENWLFEKDSLRYLSINNMLDSNASTLLPKQIKVNFALEELNMSGARINEISESFFNFYNLKKLDISNNFLTKIPDNISKSNKLEILFLNSNPIKELPKFIQNLLKLQELNLKNTNLSSLPLWVFDLPNLQILGLPNGTEFDEWYLSNIDLLEKIKKQKPNLKIY